MGNVVIEEVLEYMKVIGILAAIVILAFVALRFWLPKLTGIREAAAGPMEIACRLMLEPRKTLYVVRAGSDYVMVAASDAGVQFLAALDSAGIEAALRKVPVKPEAGFEFASLLRPRRRSQLEEGEQ
jgi:hypothetical protein